MYISFIRKGKVQVICTGEQYIFRNDWYGILAVATRKGYAPDDTPHFAIQVGNEYCSDSSLYNDAAVLAMVKHYVYKQEGTKTTYDVLKNDLSKCYIDVQVNFY